MFFYTRLGPVGIPVPDRLVDLRVLLEGVVTAAGDEDGLAVVFFHLVFEPERDFDRGLVRTGGIDDLMKLLVAVGVFQQLARLLIGFHLLEQLAELFDLFELAKVSVEGGNAAFQCVRKVIQLALAGEVDATVTNALNKEALNMALEHYRGERSDGYTHFDGHTEIYATYTGTKKYTMMLSMAAPAMALEADLAFGTQETGTAGYTYATAIQTVIQKVDGINVSLLTNSAGNVSSPVLIQEEEADLTMSNSAPAMWAANGGIESANVPECPDVRAIAGGLGHDFVNVMFTQKFVDETGIKTVGSQQCVLCSANLDEEVAYAITKAMCENTDVLAEASAALGYFDPSVAGTKAMTGCDLHPGALRYYMEMGYINENGEAAK